MNQEKSEVLFKSFEYIKARLEFKQKCMTIVVLYHPPPNKKDGLTINLFFDELSDFLERETSSACDIIILGDFNVHLDTANRDDTVRMKQMLQSLNLDQHVTEPTYVAGHILDLGSPILSATSLTLLSLTSCQTFTPSTSHSVLRNQHQLGK